MKNIKKVIIILIIVLIILAIFLIIFSSLKNTQTEYPESDANSGPQDTPIELNEYIEKEKDDNKIFMINDYINTMFLYANQNNTNALDVIVNNYEEIQQMNLEQKKSKYYIQEAYRKENLEKADYYIKGILQTSNEDYEETFSEVYLEVKLDYNNQAICIYVINQDAFNQNVQNTKKALEDFTIEKNNYNVFEQKSYSTEDICNRYISDYIIKLKYNREVAFDFLDDEYKKQKFNNDFEAFDDYIENNKENLYNLTIEKYLQEIEESSIVYTILDTNDNYYTITTIGGLDYKIKLDNYTVETEEFTNIYQQASEREKITTNISKVIRWINSKDYEQVYNKLDNTFKQNNFPTLENFETYMENNFFSNNIMEVEDIEKVSNNYVCEVLLKSGYGLASEEKTKTFIIQLLDGTDFVMSFNV